MEKLYFSRAVENSREPGNVNVGLVRENEMVRLSLYSDAFYLSEVTTVKVELKRQNESVPFEEKIITIDPAKESFLETFELGIRNDLAYDVILSLPTEEGDLDFLDETDQVVKSIKISVLVIEMLPPLERPMAFIAKMDGEQNAIDVFTSKGVRLVLASEGFKEGAPNTYLHKEVESKEVVGILFQKVAVRDTLDKGHIFLEVGPNGVILTAYRRNYLMVSLLSKEENQEPVVTSAVIDGKIMIDVTPLLQGFDFDLAKGVPEQALIKVGAGVTDQTFAQSSLLEKLLLEALPYSKVNSSGYAGFEKPALEYALINGSVSDAGSSAIVSLVKGDYSRSLLMKLASKGVVPAPKVKTFYRENDLHVVIYGEADEAAVVIKGVKPLFKAKAVTGSETHFVFKEAKDLIGSELRAVLLQEGMTSVDAVKVIKDIEELYPVFPTISEVLTSKTAASISFQYSADNRYAYARLFKDGILVRDKIKETKIVIQALQPGTKYTFQVAFVDIEEYESKRVEVLVETKESETVINYAKRLQLKVDDIEVMFKI